MKIVVTTCPKYEFLVPGFTERFNKFWGDEFLLDVAKEDESWSSQLLRICDSIDDEYIVRLCEDFWISGFDREKYERAVWSANALGVDRLGLQSIKDYVPPCTESFSEELEKMKPGSEYMCSFEASIYRRKFLLGLQPGRHIWECEIEMSQRNPNAFVLIPTERILEYKDATRRGELRVQI
ncbi:MAG: hypothetical protein AAB922_03130 [Patescibacteria group bacterium]